MNQQPVWEGVMSHLSEEELTILAERERNRSQLPLTNWESLSVQLREEGIIRDAVVARPSLNHWWLRAAAAVLLVAGGVAAGRMTASTSTKAVSSKPSTPVSLASNTSDSVRTFASDEEAWDVLNRAGADYQAASAFLATRDANMPIDSTKVYQARLAALDEMASASRKALYAAPHDPVINQYYLAAQGAREATVRQLGTSLPSGMKLVKW
jgi:hypothetical protein